MVGQEGILVRGRHIPADRIIVIRWNQPTGNRRSLGAALSITFKEEDSRQQILWVDKSDLPSLSKLKAALETTGLLID